MSVNDGGKNRQGADQALYAQSIDRQEWIARGDSYLRKAEDSDIKWYPHMAIACYMRAGLSLKELSSEGRQWVSQGDENMHRAIEANPVSYEAGLYITQKAIACYARAGLCGK